MTDQPTRKLLDQMSDAELTALYDRAEQAEAALAQSRSDWGYVVGLLIQAADWVPEGALRDRICAALNPQEARPAAEHTGGDAEDCQACHGTNPPYPFLCPGPPSEEPYDACRCTDNHAGLTLCARCPGA